MAVVSSLTLNSHKPFSLVSHSENPKFHSPKSLTSLKDRTNFCTSIKTQDFAPTKPQSRRLCLTVYGVEKDSNQKTSQDDEVKDLGVKAALSMLKFYKREISPLLPNSCRYVPTCSEYSMEAYKRYGVMKGTILTAWRLCRCNPLANISFLPNSQNLKSLVVLAAVHN
ncbi:hypothetical protein HHK36_019077 [Tetracentron sinense]|uniref:Uncharacterized protein n=1 Tax=Tetracentron sinense TaxID=13715 RepID=A0A834Z0L8_TETSI|nr:hypothetical protein HHK36_019077 [Tetracentron sinense]